MNANEWVLVVQNSALFTYQILDAEPRSRPPTVWIRLVRNAIVYGCALYGIPARSALDFIWD